MLPRFRRGAFALFALSFFVTLLLGDRPLALGLTPSELLAGRTWWTPLTAMLREPEGLGLLALLWTLICQWLFGSRLEGFWGSTRYLVMVLVAALLGYASVVGLALVVPEAASIEFSGAGPINTAAAVAFAWVFAKEHWYFGTAELPPVAVGVVGAVIASAFPLLVTVVAGTPVAAAWPSMIPGVMAAVVATLFVQPWRQREKSGKVGREQRPHSHLRVIRSAEDMLD